MNATIALSDKVREIIKARAEFIRTAALDDILQNDLEQSTPVFDAWHSMSVRETSAIEAKLLSHIQDELEWLAILIAQQTEGAE